MNIEDVEDRYYSDTGDLGLQERIAELEAENADLLEMLNECLAYFSGEWESVGRHPASRYAEWVDMISATIAKEGSNE